MLKNDCAEGSLYRGKSQGLQAALALGHDVQGRQWCDEGKGWEVDSRALGSVASYGTVRMP